MILNKYRSNIGDETFYMCDCDESAEFSFREAYDPWTNRLVCPFCGEEYDFDPEDRPAGFDPDDEYGDPMTADEFYHMKGVR